MKQLAILVLIMRIILVRLEVRQLRCFISKLNDHQLPDGLGHRTGEHRASLSCPWTQPAPTHPLQGLRQQITSWQRLACSDQRLYLKVARRAAIGLLKVSPSAKNEGCVFLKRFFADFKANLRQHFSKSSMNLIGFFSKLHL